MSAYLYDRPRALTEYRDIVQSLIEDAGERIRIWTAAIEHANGEEHDILGTAIDQASDELARLEDRLDMLDEELGYRRDDDPGMPLVL